MSTSSTLTTIQLDRSLFREEPEGALTAWSVAGGLDFGLDCPSKEQRKKKHYSSRHNCIDFFPPKHFLQLSQLFLNWKRVSVLFRPSMLRQVLSTHLGLSLQRRPWLAWGPQFVGRESQRRPPSSGTPAAVCQPTGPEPPWPHCGAPSGDSHQLHEGKQQEEEQQKVEWLSSCSQF